MYSSGGVVPFNLKYAKHNLKNHLKQQTGSCQFPEFQTHTSEVKLRSGYIGLMFFGSLRNNLVTI